VTIKIDEIICSRRKTLALQINSEGKLIVRAPYRMHQSFIEQFISQKKEWILAKQAQATTRHQARQALKHRYLSGEKFLFLGHDYPLSLVDVSKQGKTKLAKKLMLCDQGFLMLEQYQHQAKKIFIEWYKNEAQVFFAHQVRMYAEKHQLTYREIKVGHALKRWGSCSSQKNLNFSWRLMMAPIEVINYVIVHELAHLLHLNHSATFWRQVEKMMPDYSVYRQWLKSYGHQMGSLE